MAHGSPNHLQMREFSAKAVQVTTPQGTWLERSASVVAAGAAAFVSATLLFASGFFTVVGLEFARFYRIEELSPLFLPSFISLVIGAIVISAIFFARYLLGELAESANKPRNFSPRLMRNIRVLGWTAFVGYVVLLILMPLSWHSWALSLLVIVKGSIDDQAHWIAVRDNTSEKRSHVPDMLFAAAFCFNLGQSHAFSEVRNLETFCAHVPIKGGYFDGVVLLTSDDGFLGFDAAGAAFVQFDKDGNLIDRRPYDPGKSLLSIPRERSTHEKLLFGFSCLARQQGKKALEAGFLKMKIGS